LLLYVFIQHFIQLYLFMQSCSYFRLFFLLFLLGISFSCLTLHLLYQTLILEFTGEVDKESAINGLTQQYQSAVVS
jgi:hypothetical protein